jgi:threonyl-tRNA synthetase
LKSNGIRVEVDSRSEKIGSKIRDAEMQKVNIMVIVGEKEVEDKTLTIRRRFIKQQQTVSLEDFSNEIIDEINDRRVPN